MSYVATQVVKLPVVLYLELDLYLMKTKPGVAIDEHVAELLQRWLSIEKERQSLRQNGPPLDGFQWKSVFLPDGTNLRTRHGGHTDFAKVVGDRILFNRECVTPSTFANRNAAGRNAWRCVWLRFPGDEDWIRADDCRARLDKKARSDCQTRTAVSNAAAFD